MIRMSFYWTDSDSIPPHRRLFILSPAELEASRDHITKHLNSGKMKQIKSPYWVPLFFFKENYKPLRGYLYYRSLNRIKMKEISSTNIWRYYRPTQRSKFLRWTWKLDLIKYELWVRMFWRQNSVPITANKSTLLCLWIFLMPLIHSTPLWIKYFRISSTCLLLYTCNNCSYLEINFQNNWNMSKLCYPTSFNTNNTCLQKYVPFFQKK